MWLEVGLDSDDVELLIGYKKLKFCVKNRCLHNLRYEAKHLNKYTAELSVRRLNSADKRSKSPRRLVNFK